MLSILSCRNISLKGVYQVSQLSPVPLEVPMGLSHFFLDVTHLSIHKGLIFVLPNLPVRRGEDLMFQVLPVSFFHDMVPVDFSAL